MLRVVLSVAVLLTCLVVPSLAGTSVQMQQCPTVVEQPTVYVQPAPVIVQQAAVIPPQVTIATVPVMAAVPYEQTTVRERHVTVTKRNGFFARRREALAVPVATVNTQCVGVACEGAHR